MVYRNLRLGVFLTLALVLSLVSVSANYVGDFSAGTYAAGDTVSYNGSCYEAVGQLSSIPESYNPEGSFSHFWTEVNSSNCVVDSPSDNSSSDGSLWVSNTDYVVGDVVSYNGTSYKVVQAHRSQSDWKPDVVPALFRPYQKSTKTSYLSVKYNTNATEYKSFNRSSLIDKMQFSYVGSESTVKGVRFSWNFYKPVPRTNSVSWVLKPIRFIVSNDEITACTQNRTVSDCYNSLVVSVADDNVTSVKERALSTARGEVESALQVRNRLTSSTDYFVNQQGPGDLLLE